jgi:hypothetical protein
MYKCSCSATSSPTVVVVIALEYGHSNWGEMKSKCSIDLDHFYTQGTCCFTTTQKSGGQLIMDWNLQIYEPRKTPFLFPHLRHFVVVTK